MEGMRWFSVDDLAGQADVDPEYVRRLIDLGALERAEGRRPYGLSDIRRVRLLRAWEDAGLSVEAIMSVVRTGALSISWLDSPVMTRAERLDQTYEELCAESGAPMSLIQALYEAIGLAPPDPADRARQGDRELVSLIQTFVAGGAREEPTLRLLRVYADSLRRIAKAEAELYESEIESRLRDSGLGERELLDYGARFGDQVLASLVRALIDIYHRHREHIWIEHSINHAEVALDLAGLHQKVPRPPSICFVDLTGYTRLTEERGDEVAARLAGSLATLVEDISRRRGGRPIRWLGDGGMFHFRQPNAAVLSALDMIESAPRAGLPPMHIGIHTGPVIFQDGDVYGRTVNLASRIASHASAGQVLASEETVQRFSGGGVRFEPVGPVNLKGVDRHVQLYQAVRDSTPDALRS
ncbi:MAG: adenylate/guanylate cyclase domain-containing protein [Actinomycetota bacterium]